MTAIGDGGFRAGQVKHIAPLADCQCQIGFYLLNVFVETPAEIGKALRIIGQ